MAENNKTLTTTAEGYQALIDELEYRKGPETEAIKKRIETARGFGDLSENSEYDEAKDAQAKNVARILELEEQIKNTVVFDSSKIRDGVVNLGTTVTVKINGNMQKVYHIVGSNQVNALEGKISDQSPIGSALINKKSGDVITVKTQSGELSVEILNVERTKN